ncbi:MAG: hypothetical protein ACFBRM_15030, partial [Pikeienuella sp.]
KLLRVSGGTPGLRYEVVVAPNEAIKASKRAGVVSEYVKEKRRAYWPIFTEELEADPDFADAVTTHGGGLGHIYVFPKPIYRDSDQRPRVIAYINLRADGADLANAMCDMQGYHEPENEARTDRLRSLTAAAIEAAGLPSGIEPTSGQETRIVAKMSDEAAMRETARRHLAIVKCCMRALTEVFDPQV